MTAVRRFLLYTLPKGSKVGLVEYSSRAQILTPQLEKITDDVSRRTLSGKVIPKKTGKTAIGQGLLRAKQVREACYFLRSDRLCRRESSGLLSSLVL